MRSKSDIKCDTEDKAVDHHVCGRVRHFLTRRHKVPNRGIRRFPHYMIYGGLGVLPLDYHRVPHNQSESRMREIRRSGLMSGERKRGCLHGLQPRLSSTLPFAQRSRGSLHSG